MRLAAQLDEIASHQIMFYSLIMGGVSDADFGLLAEYGMVRVIGVWRRLPQIIS